MQTFIIILMSRVDKYFRILFLGGSKLTHYFDVNSAQIVQNTLFRGVSKLTHYFDVKGAQIFQNTLFRGVQTFIIILMCRAHKYFRILYLGGCPN